MDIDSLNAFISIVETGSFSKAADAISVTQPAISKRIRTLEEVLNCKLFERGQRDIQLTKEGEELLPRATSILREVQNAKQSILNISSDISGQLTVVASHHIGLHRLPFVIKPFLQKYPDVDLKLLFMESENAFEALDHNHADIGFITVTPGAYPNYVEHVIWNDPMSIVCAPDHELATSQSTSIEKLSKASAILPSKTTLTYQIIEKLFASQQLKLNAAIPTNYLETIKMMVSVGLGWSVLPNTMIDEHLAILSTPEYSPSRKLGAVTHKRKTVSNAAKALIEQAEKVWGNEG
ncbi:LysR family transcriptional regulator [Alkalimarinus coralli]|uniref:LysR family transcriptional regulator n=1 Tax=Alkalimarinus coralli TaxID=2935863 RepID=UPI00202AE171|nr:LysR family transcriptional regulator [Alkalimarinus coralli]